MGRLRVDIGRLMDQLQSDQMLLFATDFPHWQYDGDPMLPAGIDPRCARKSSSITHWPPIHA